MRAVVAALALAVAARAARADDDSRAWAAQALPFVTLDRAASTSRAGLDVGLQPAQGAFALRFDAYGQYVEPTLGLGGYVQMPVSYASYQNTTSTGPGDLELGAIYAPSFGRSAIGLVLRAGVTLPTAPHDTFNVATASTTFVRITDEYQTIPHGTSLRLAADTVYRSRWVFARMDLGLDHNFSADLAAGNVQRVVRIDLGVGITPIPQLELTLENANVFVMAGQGGTPFAQTFFSTVAIAGRWLATPVRPVVALGIPIATAPATATGQSTLPFVIVGADIPLP